MALPALLYLHIPFCLRKCAYCDFYSESGHSEEERYFYVQAMIAELHSEARHWRDYQFDSIYFGGGTPSLLGLSDITALMTAISRHYSLAPDLEVSLEANPGTIKIQHLAGLRDAGINRVSLGVQSFHDGELALLGRSHTVADSISCLEALTPAGFDNFNIDLIYGLPGQSLERWQYSLSMAADINCSHLSVYLLQLEAQTPMGQAVERGEMILPEEDEQAEYYTGARDALAARAYTQYELSNFARSGKICRHNVGYWNMQEYLGVGAGAVSRQGYQRRLNSGSLSDYIQSWRCGTAVARTILEEMAAEDLLSEGLILGLRMLRGVDIGGLERRFHRRLSATQWEGIEYCREAGLLAWEDDRLQLTSRGLFLSNQVLRLLI